MKKFILLIGVFFLSMEMVSANPKLLVIDWPFAKKSTGMTVLSAKALPYPLQLVSKASQVRLPVYMPATYVYQTNIQMVGDGDFYTITIPLPNAILFMTGDRAYQQDSIVDINVIVRTQEMSFLRAEGMVNVDFNRHGANYSLSIECEKPETDQRCVQTDFLQQMYSDLIMVGGQP